MKPSAVAAALVVVLSSAERASATAVGCNQHQARGVVVSHCSNHGWRPRSLDRSLAHAAAGLAVARARLVAAERLDDRPVLYELEASPRDGLAARLDRPDRCEASTGDGDTVEAPLGPCYRITTTHRDYGSLLTLLAALPDLAEHGPSAEVHDLAELAAHTRTQRPSLGGIAMVVRTTTSPDRRHAVRERWRDGVLSLELLRHGRVVRALPDLHGYLAGSPLWSPGSDRIAYVSEDAAVVADVQSGDSWRFDISGELEPGTRANEVGIAFENDASKLFVTADTQAFFAYRSWVIDLDTAKGRELPPSDERPDWAILP
jgi:hypothetical protein